MMFAIESLGIGRQGYPNANCNLILAQQIGEERGSLYTLVVVCSMYYKYKYKYAIVEKVTQINRGSL